MFHAASLPNLFRLQVQLPAIARKGALPPTFQVIKDLSNIVTVLLISVPLLGCFSIGGELSICGIDIFSGFGDQLVKIQRLNDKNQKWVGQ